MLDESRAFHAVIHGIDRFTSAAGNIVAWLILPLVAAVTYEVMARYLFRAPTIWAFDLTYQLYAAIFMLGAGFALLRGAHIRTDMLWNKYSERQKGLVDLIAYLCFFFPGLALLFWSSVDDAIYSFSINERSEQTAWRPLLWPFRSIVPIASAFLLIQGLSEALKSYYAVQTGRLYERKMGGEV